MELNWWKWRCKLMRIERNAILTMREMLAEPEKDWSNHIPFVKITEGDFEKARTLIKKHCKNADKRDEVMRRFENYKKRYETNDFNRPEHLSDFVWHLKYWLESRKQWETKQLIRKEIEEVFNTEKYFQLETFFEPFELWYEDIKTKKMYEVKCEEKHKELLETFDSQEAKIREFFVEQN